MTSHSVTTSTSSPATMQAALLRSLGGPLTVSEVPRPRVRRGEVLVRVQAVAALPHQRLAFAGQGPFRMPELPAVVGWDACGEVVEVGDGVPELSSGDRVYLQPIVSCGLCRSCRRGSPLTCEAFMLQGGFGLGPNSGELQQRHDGGGFAEYMRVPAGNAVRLPEGMSCEDGVRIGYAGIAYRALRRGRVSAGKSVLIMGATGNVGVPAVGIAAALGADQILAVARDQGRLAAVAAWVDDPRVRTISVAEGQASLRQQVDAATGGRGVDVVVDLLDASRGTGPRSVEAGLSCLAAEGVGVLVGAIFEPLSIDYMSLVTHDRALIGSHGYTPVEVHELVAMIDSGVYRMPKFETRAFPLARVNEALDLACERPGGLTNIVVQPWDVRSS